MKDYNYQPAGDFIVVTAGNIDNLDIQKCSYLVMNNPTASVIRGVKAGFAGQILNIIAIGAGAVTIAHQSGASLAANRFINAIGDTVRVGWSTTYQYDSAVARWRQVTESKGWQNNPYNAADYVGSTGAWTVTAPNVTTFRYRITPDNTMTINVFIQNTNVAVGGGTLNVTIPAGRLSASVCAQPCYVVNAGAPQILGFTLFSTGSGQMFFFASEAGGTFSATAANDTQVIGFFEIEVQP